MESMIGIRTLGDDSQILIVLTRFECSLRLILLVSKSLKVHRKTYEKLY